MVGINLPLNQLACTGIGQAQPLTQLLRMIQMEISAGKTAILTKYLDRLQATIRRGNKRSFPARLLQAYLFQWLRRPVLSCLSTIEQARYSRKFLSQTAVRERFRSYFHTSLNEIQRLRNEHGTEIPDPNYVVFGHTHQPIPWGSDELIDKVNGHGIHLCNTGGWLLREEAGRVDFVGADVVIYESGKGIWSESIRASHLSAKSNGCTAPSTPF
jgi:hypothetical protein